MVKYVKGVVVVAVSVGFAFLFVALKPDQEPAKKTVDSTVVATEKAASIATKEVTTQTQKKPVEQGVYAVRVSDAGPVGGVKKISVKSGEKISLKVTSDTAGQIHIHGYELEKEIDAGGSVTFNFKAKLEGVFEVELHKEVGEEQIASLSVGP